MLALEEEKARIGALLTALVTKTAPRLLEVDGVGIDTAAAFPMPAAEPVLLALPAGVIAQAAWVSLRAAFHGLRTSPLPLTQTAASHHHGRHHHRAGGAHGRLSMPGSTPQPTVPTRR